MPRIRALKPDFFKNEDLHQKLGPLAALLFAGLWCWADRDGRLEDRPARLKIEILPYYDCDADALLQQLHDAGFIVRYEAEGIRCIWICTFKEHQRITGKEAETPSTLPEPPPKKQKGSNGETTGKQSGNIGDDRKGKERKYIPPFIPPQGEAVFPGNDLLESKWQEWLKYRKEQRVKTTQTTLDKQIAFLKTQPDPIAVLEQSMLSGYRGLFPLKATKPPPRSDSPPRRSKEELARLTS